MHCYTLQYPLKTSEFFDKQHLAPIVVVAYPTRTHILQVADRYQHLHLIHHTYRPTQQKQQPSGFLRVHHLADVDNARCVGG
jgi:hypothetical protein